MDNSDFETFESKLIVSRVTTDRLKNYAELLREWNEKFNLVAANSLNQIWTRHFLDCGQLYSFIPDTTINLADMGSGAGFPGLVLAIMALERPSPFQTTLIESTNKKADFLQTLSERLQLNVTVRRERIEAIRDLKPGVITARALKPLPDLLKYANYLLSPDTICLFPKGRTVADELTQARKYWTFTLDQQPSLSDASGSILIMSGLRYKTRR